MKKSRILVMAAVFASVFAFPAWAGAATVTVDDQEQRLSTADLEIESATFTYTAKRVSIKVGFSYLPDYVEYFTFQARGPRGHTWAAGLSHDEAEDWSDPRRDKWFTHFMWPGESAEKVRCKSRWRVDLEDETVALSFPSKCLRVEGRPVPWLRMTFEAMDVWEGSYIWDSAPGGNSNNEKPARFTRRVQRG